MEFFKETHIDFMRIRWITLAVSLVVIAAGGFSYYKKGGFSYGVDFAGGTMVQLKFKSPQDIGKLRSRLTAIGYGGSRIQQLTGENEFIVKVEQGSKAESTMSEAELDAVRAKIVEGFESADERSQLAAGKVDLNTIGADRLALLLDPIVASAGGNTAPAREIAEKILDARKTPGLFHNLDELKAIPGVTDAVFTGLKQKVFLGEMSVVRTEIVGPQVGKELRRKGIGATIGALVGMLIYIAFRFQFVYGVSTIVTLTHDVLVTCGMLSLFNYDVDLTIVAGILTIVGFSVNDTIVIFDRIRDNVKIMKKDSLSDICNKSVNQTLSRTILTSGTVFVTVVALFFFGGDVIHPFAFTMLVGVISGSYSTIYISCPILLWWKEIGDSWKARSARR
ncbi:MAG: protein translocase subunit SecF [Acidobacteriota bacterium]